MLIIWNTGIAQQCVWYGLQNISSIKQVSNTESGRDFDWLVWMMCAWNHVPCRSRGPSHVNVSYHSLPHTQVLFLKTGDGGSQTAFFELRRGKCERSVKFCNLRILNWPFKCFWTLNGHGWACRCLIIPRVMGGGVSHVSFNFIWYLVYHTFSLALGPGWVISWLSMTQDITWKTFLRLILHLKNYIQEMPYFSCPILGHPFFLSDSRTPRGEGARYWIELNEAGTPVLNTQWFGWITDQHPPMPNMC